MVLRIFSFIVKITILILCLLVQLSTMPVILFGHAIIVHCVFLLVICMIFLNDWYWGLAGLFIGTILLTQLSEISSIPVMVSYGAGTIVFLFLSDFLLKSRSAFILSINVLCGVTIMLLTHTLLLHLIVQTERALLSRDDLIAIALSLCVHAMVMIAVSFGVLIIDQFFRNKGAYVK